MQTTPKSSMIVSATFTNQWTAPNGSIIYYYDLMLENGDQGKIGVAELNSPKISIHSFVSYTIEDGNNGIKKIKILSSDSENTQAKITKQQSYSKAKTYNKMNNNSTQQYGKSNKYRQPEEYLGYVWAYAKDLLIAGKTSQDLEELNNMATYIYDKIKEMLDNNSSEE